MKTISNTQLKRLPEYRAFLKLLKAEQKKIDEIVRDREMGYSKQTGYVPNHISSILDTVLAVKVFSGNESFITTVRNYFQRAIEINDIYDAFKTLKT